MPRRPQYPAAKTRLSMHKVSIEDQGRCGTVTYDEGGGRRLTGYWEFGGDDVVVYVRCGRVDEWASQAWALPRRAGILQAIAHELVRQRAPSCRADIDHASGEIRLRASGDARTAVTSSDGSPVSSPAARGPAATGKVAASTRAAEAQWVFRLTELRAKLGLVVLAGALLLGAGVWLKNTLFSIDPGKGTAIGDTVRTDRHIATLIENGEAYVPSLDRNHGDDRYSVSLFLVPLDGSPPRLVPLRSGLEPGASGTAKIFGSDGRALWFNVAGVGGVKLDDYSLLPESEVAAVDPRSLPRPWGVWPMAPRLEQLLDADAVTNNGYIDAAWVRSGSGAPAMRFTDPPGALLLYTSSPGSQGTAVVARFDANGQPLWHVDTGIGRSGLRQILPGEHSTAFVGTRPPIPDKLSEPLLVIVDHRSGAQVTHSLWQ